MAKPVPLVIGILAILIGAFGTIFSFIPMAQGALHSGTLMQTQFAGVFLEVFASINQLAFITMITSVALIMLGIAFLYQSKEL